MRVVQVSVDGSGKKLVVTEKTGLVYSDSMPNLEDATQLGSCFRQKDKQTETAFVPYVTDFNVLSMTHENLALVLFDEFIEGGET